MWHINAYNNIENIVLYIYKSKCTAVRARNLRKCYVAGSIDVSYLCILIPPRFFLLNIIRMLSIYFIHKLVALTALLLICSSNDIQMLRTLHCLPSCHDFFFHFDFNSHVSGNMKVYLVIMFHNTMLLCHSHPYID